MRNMRKNIIMVPSYKWYEPDGFIFRPIRPFSPDITSFVW